VGVLKFRLRRPVITFLEGLSGSQSKQYKNVWLGLNFLSVMGHDVAKLPTNAYIQEKQEKCAIMLIG
jgi:hypothetical protein